MQEESKSLWRNLFLLERKVPKIWKKNSFLQGSLYNTWGNMTDPVEMH